MGWEYQLVQVPGLYVRHELEPEHAALHPGLAPIIQRWAGAGWMLLGVYPGSWGAQLHFRRRRDDAPALGVPPRQSPQELIE